MKLNWHQYVLYVTTMGMEGCWLYVLMVMLNHVNGERLSVLWLLLLYPVAFGFNRLLQRLKLPRPRITVRAISWIAWAVAMLLFVKVQLYGSVALTDTTWLLAVPQAIAHLLETFRPELLVLLATAILWWLGRRLAYQKASFAAAASEFQFGLVMLLIVFFVNAQLNLNVNSIPVALVFFLFALSGMSIGHATEGGGWLSGLYRGHWSVLLLASIGMVIVFGLVISVLVTPDLLQVVLNALKWAVGIVWGAFVKLMLWLASLIPEPKPMPLPASPSMPGGNPDEGFTLEMPEVLRTALRIGVSVLFLGFVLAALWQVSSQILAWLRRKLSSMEGVEIEPLSGAFLADLLNFLKRLLFKLLKLKLPIRLRGRAAAPEINTVRQIYRQLLRWAAAGGYPRHLSQTPHEYRYALAGVLPEARADLDLITRQYISARYGLAPPTENELAQLKESWHNIKENRLKKPEDATRR